MVQNSGQQRSQTYFQLSSQLVQMDNAQLSSLFATSESSAGWGENQTVEINGTNIFVKRVPVTDLEMANMFSTSNLYDLPIYYHYGVSSAGFGVFRELLGHVKTTNWVLMFTLFENIEEIQASGIFQIHKALLDAMTRYRSICVLMDNFYSELIPNNQKDTIFPDVELGRLLKDTGFFADPDGGNDSSASRGS